MVVPNTHRTINLGWETCGFDLGMSDDATL